MIRNMEEFSKPFEALVVAQHAEHFGPSKPPLHFMKQTLVNTLNNYEFLRHALHDAVDRANK